MPILPFINLKGGVAKTTNSVAVAECLASQGKRVLVVDADHQCMASELLLGESRLLASERKRTTLHDLLGAMLDPDFEVESLGTYLIPNASDIGGGFSNLSVLPCSIRIDDFSTNMAKARNGYRSTEEFMTEFTRRRKRVRTWLLKHFDYVIVDCPPSVPVQVRFMIAVSDAFIVPSVPDRLSVRGSLYLLDRLRRMNFRATALGTLWSLYREQNPMHRRVVEAVKSGMDAYSTLPRPFETIIPNAAAIAESTETARNPSSFNAKYKSEFAKLFRALTNEIESRCDFKLGSGGGVRALVSTVDG